VLFEKHRLTKADAGYAIAVWPVLGAERVVAASENQGAAYAFTPPEYQPVLLCEGPSGSMGFAPVPNRDDALFMITGFYPIFRSEAAGINLISATSGLETPWQTRRVVDLPFVHRIATVETADGPVILAATVCEGKDYQDDWSRPGTVYAIRIPADLDGEWEPRPVLEGIVRNHGMSPGVHRGRRCIFISGAEGLFALHPPESPGAPWESEAVIKTEISEMVAVDLDGDGEDELITIEPFHGDRLVVYKRRGEYQAVAEATLSFGHGLWAGTLEGRPAVVVGNRSGENNLVCFEAIGSDPLTLRESVVDRGSGSANTAVIQSSDGDRIVTSNPVLGEYARYRVLPE